MKDYSPPSVRFQDALGVWYELRQTSINQRENLLRTLRSLQAHLEQLPDDQRFSDAWDWDSKLRYLCTQACQYAGVPPAAELSLSHYVTFLFPSADYPHGLLAELNFTPGSAAGGEPVTHAELLALLWRVTGSLEECQLLADQFAADEALELLNQKIQQDHESTLTPEEKLKEKARREFKRDRNP